ncbi:hypothetical protein PAECIP111893_02414 [Paenibacillus plantiphilus]|uniref:Uncharacterized protein n=1 Tax=Paenibacillus plantiphilus TaxID=2905650 RepID=A0ABN8GCJ8_9BACL|nr:hypothetical protein PAECIP111893_02414 [Paenibacillus plantiphilus]
MKPKHQDYRVCYDNWDRSIANKLYAVSKHCECEACNTRFKIKRLPPNWASATTPDITKVDEVADFLETWNCGTDTWLRSPIILKF